MRKALFAIVLIAASFAGGAVINGPGLRWAQTFLLSRLNMDGEGDVDASATPGEPAEEIPSRPIPPLVITPSPSEANTSNAPAPSSAPAPDDSHEAVARASRPAPAESSSPSHLPGLAPVPEGPSSTPAREQPQPRPVAVADATPPAIQIEADRKVESPGDPDKSHDSAIRRVSLTNNPGDDAPAEVPPLSLSPPEPSPAAGPSGSGDWAEVRETMRTLGVSRYGTEGEPGGRVRFHCVIPLAGRRAVSQHFEAEGDDDLQAARAALKRVALWKATEGDGNAP